MVGKWYTIVDFERATRCAAMAFEQAGASGKAVSAIDDGVRRAVYRESARLGVEIGMCRAGLCGAVSYWEVPSLDCAGRCIGRAPAWVGRLECAVRGYAGRRRIGEAPSLDRAGRSIGRAPVWVGRLECAVLGYAGRRRIGEAPRLDCAGRRIGKSPAGREDWNVPCWIAQGGASGERPSGRGDWNVSCWAMQGGVALESACAGSRRAALYRENACTGEEIEMCWGGSGGCTMC